MEAIDVEKYLQDVQERSAETMRVYSHSILRLKDSSATLNMVSRHIVGYVFAISGIDLLLIAAITGDLACLGVGLAFLFWGIYKLYRSIHRYHDDIKENGEQYGLVYPTVPANP